MDLPTLAIMTTTWAPDTEVGISRRASAEKAIRSWKKHLKYDGELRLHIADDGSLLPGYPDTLGKIWPGATVTRQERQGVGASLNNGFEAVISWETPVAAYLVDDWALTAPLDLTPWVRVLIEDDSVGMVRLGLPHPDLTGMVKHLGVNGWGLLLARHHYACGHRPALYHRRFLEAYGRFLEGVSAMDCEQAYAQQFNNGVGPEVMVAMPHPWVHVGESEVGDVVPEGAPALVTA